MENLLLVLDEIDDVYSMIGLVWRPVASFLLAAALFVATGMIFVVMPVLVEVMAFALVSLGLVDFVRRRRAVAASVAVEH